MAKLIAVSQKCVFSTPYDGPEIQVYVSRDGRARSYSPTLASQDRVLKLMEFGSIVEIEDNCLSAFKFWGKSHD